MTRIRTSQALRLLTSTTVAAMVAAVCSVLAGAPAAADDGRATASPVVQRSADTVTADALPTVQIDGVVWSEAVVGNTVYAGGNFAKARPAGSAAGVNTVARTDLLSFDITTGALISSFAPTLNAQVKVVASSPDGSRIYVGGSFTQVNGVNRYRIAAFSTATGALLTTFAPALDATVNAIAATNSTVYVGGIFTTANGQSRTRLAAFNASNGALLAWAPTADNIVQAAQLSPDGTRLVIGGNFQNVNGAAAYGLAALDPATGAMYTWAAVSEIRDAGSGASILSLSSDGSTIYATGYNYGGSGNFEGIVAADPDSGTIKWVADCHGDTYSTFGVNGVVYSASHQHDCTNIGGFPDTNPRNVWYRATAFTADATGVVQPNDATSYWEHKGQPSPSLITWLPNLTAGTFTGQYQAAWAVAGNARYVVAGGEFPSVNGTAQQGLVRFAVSSIAPNKMGPRVSAADFTPSLVARSSTSVRVGWQANYDLDDQNLSYTVYRDSVAVRTLTATSQPWNRPFLGILDTGLAAGSTHTYRLKATDPSGNSAWGNTLSVTTPATDPPADSRYVADVLAAGAVDYWRLDQAAGQQDDDYAGYSDLTANAGVTAGASGALSDDAAATFDGSTGTATTSSAVLAPSTFTASAWFRTTTTAGGRILGFGNASTGLSSISDRMIYLDRSGRVNFGVNFRGHYVVTSSRSYNDGQWHQAAASLSGSGLALYVDGVLVASSTATTMALPYDGYWRIGGDTSWSGASYFAGSIDEVAIYPGVLSAAQLRTQYADSGRSGGGFTAPSDGYGASVWNDSPSGYYRLDETSGSTATDVSGNGGSGRYSGTVSLGASSPVAGVGTAVRFGGSGTLALGSSAAAPSAYSVELWFATTSGAGGKLIGFGSSQTGTSSRTDRNVYLLADGRVVFGVNGGADRAVSTRSYNDGAWHHLVATQGASGMVLYLDGVAVAANAQTAATQLSGYWRVGGDSLAGWGADGSYLTGTVDEVAVYPLALSAAKVRAHLLASPVSALHVPTADFTAGVTDATVSVDASASVDPDGAMSAYAWDFGDGARDTGVQATHTYAASGSYPVTLTVTGAAGLSASLTRQVTATVPDQPPAAAFAVTVNGRHAEFDASASADPDGTIASYDWVFGDGATGSGPSPGHDYAAPGSYQAVLTVTDDRGATDSVTHTVTIAANQAPTATFTAASADLSESFDGSGSSDPDGTIAGYAWTFGDGATGTGPAPGHDYARAGSYQVSLTVTDDQGATGTVTRTVDVPTGLLAGDTFDRTVAAGGWGSADVGGAWTGSNGMSQLSVSGGVAAARLNAVNASPTAMLNGVSAANVDIAVDTSVDAVTTGGGVYVSLLARHSGSSDYRLKVRYLPAGAIHLVLSRIVSGTETTLREVNVSSLTYQPGDTFRVRFVVTGTATASLSGTIWRTGTARPASPQITGSDSTAALAAPGAVGLVSYLSGSATSVPVVTRYDNLLVVRS